MHLSVYGTDLAVWVEMAAELEQRWQVLVRSEESGAVETVEIELPTAPGYRDEAMRQALSRCFRGKGWQKCTAMSARPLPDGEKS